MSNEVRVRYAPSPTGHLHIGNTRTALFNYLFARNAGGKFIIRIEDTDQKRNVEGGEESQFKHLKWLGINWDESSDIGGPFGPYRQMERLEIYQKYTDELLAKGHAYKCYCSEEELEAEREGQVERGENPAYSGKCRHLTDEQKASLEAEGRKPSIRFVVPSGKTYTFTDMIKKQVSFESDVFGDWVIVKKDGIPTYNYAVVIDDYLMKITHVLRGEEHLTNTPKQLMLYEVFGWDAPTYGHMTLIVNENHKKLSKRDESVIQFIEQYKNLGFLPEAMVNFIALLGWHPGGEQEIYSLKELEEIFDASRLSTSPAMFDRQKLSYLNNQYMKKADVEKVVELVLPHLVKAGRVSAEMTVEEAEWVHKLVVIYKDYMSYGAEIVELSNLFFQEELSFDEVATEVLSGETVPTVLAAFLEEVKLLENFMAEEIQSAMKRVQTATGQKGKNLFMPVRVAIFGQVHGPDLMKSIELLGREKVKNRLEQRLASF